MEWNKKGGKQTNEQTNKLFTVFGSLTYSDYNMSLSFSITLYESAFSSHKEDKNETSVLVTKSEKHVEIHCEVDMRSVRTAQHAPVSDVTNCMNAKTRQTKRQLFLILNIWVFLCCVFD